MSGDDVRSRIEAELAQTAFQRKVVSYNDLDRTIAAAIDFFTARGYKSGRTGRPNQVYIRGGREGLLPRVNAEILIQTNVGKGKVTMVSISGAGVRLKGVLEEYANHLREQGRAMRQQSRG